MVRGSHFALIALAGAAMPTCGWIAREAPPSSDVTSATPLSYGLALSGEGEASIDDVEVTVVR